MPDGKVEAGMGTSSKAARPLRQTGSPTDDIMRIRPLGAPGRLHLINCPLLARFSRARKGERPVTPSDGTGRQDWLQVDGRRWVLESEVPNLQQQIAEKFLAALTEGKDLDTDQIEQLRQLLMRGKKPKADEFIRVFTMRAGGGVK